MPQSSVSNSRGRVRVARDDERDAAVARGPRHRVAEVEAVDLTVDLQRDARCGCRREDGVDVEAQRLASQEHAARRVPDDVDPRARDGRQQAIGHRGRFQPEAGMHGGDDEVELGEAVVRQVESAVAPDVALDARQQADAVEPRVERADPGGVLQRPALVEAVGHRQRLAVVGDRQVLESGRACRAAIVSRSSLPSVTLVWLCRSPRRS